jgi:hypothetical protein
MNLYFALKKYSLRLSPFVVVYFTLAIIAPSVNALAVQQKSVEQQKSNEPANTLPVFVVTTPSPITDYSTISNAHIRLLEAAFLKLGFQLQMQLELAETTRKQFQAQRYDGSIFIEGKSENAGGLRIEKPLEYVHFDLFCLIETCREFEQNSIPNSTVIAATGLGSNIIQQEFADKQFDIVKANHPEHLLRLVKSERAQLGLTGRPILHSQLTLNENGENQFSTIGGISIKRGLYLHLTESNAEFKQRLEQLLIEEYHPKTNAISNNP